MQGSSWFLEQQKLQFSHDSTYHQDIHCLCRNDRLKHYALHFAKYCGRLERDNNPESVKKTLADYTLIALSAANTLGDNLSKVEINASSTPLSVGDVKPILVDEVGRFCDACEKIDHAEEFLTLAKPANRRILQTLSALSLGLQVNLDSLVSARRAELRDRAFYI